MNARPPAARRRSLRQIFAIPLALGLLGIAGLVSALVGDGIWDAFSWLALAAPIVLCVYFLLKRRLGLSFSRSD